MRSSITVPHRVAAWKSWGILFLLSLIWGSSYILIKKGLIAFSADQVGALRMGVSALAFLPLLAYHFRRMDWSKWPYLLVVGFAGSAVPAFLFAIAQTKISSSLAGILSSLTPLFTLVLGILLFQKSAGWSKVLGIFVGLFGAAVLISGGTGMGISGNGWYALLVLLACACYALSANTVGSFLQNMNPVAISAASFSIAGLPALLYLLTTDFWSVVTNDPHGLLSLGAITVLALLSTVWASVLFFRLIQWTNAVFASMISYMTPVVALAWGVFDGEPVALLHIFGLALILSGVYLVKNA